MNQNPTSSQAIRKKKIILAVLHLIAGSVICYFMAMLFMHPGLLSKILYYVLLDLPEIKELFTFIAWLLIGAINLMIICAVLWIIILSPVVTLFLLLFLGIPSFSGAIGMFLNKKWGIQWVRFSAYVYMLIFPLGTALAIYTFRTCKKIKSQIID